MEVLDGLIECVLVKPVISCFFQIYHSSAKIADVSRRCVSGHFENVEIRVRAFDLEPAKRLIFTPGTGISCTNIQFI